MTDEPSMAKAISEIMDLCWVSKNDHLRWFRRLLDNHFEGIIAHATYAISSGKIEGVNNRTKTLRRKGYGYADDEYFFLKLMFKDAHNQQGDKTGKKMRIDTILS